MRHRDIVAMPGKCKRYANTRKDKVGVLTEINSSIYSNPVISTFTLCSYRSSAIVT